VFDFNLQLFAEGETTDVSTATTTNENVAGAAQEPQPESLYLVTDPRTGRKSISSAKPEPTEPAETKTEEPPVQDELESQPTEPTEPAATEPAAEKQPEPLIHTEPYTLDELNTAIAQGNVNESRIPQQYQLQYAQYQQEQARRQQQYQQQQQALQMQAQQQQLEQQKRMFADIDKAATDQAMKAIGITQDDIDTAEYSDDDAVKQKVAHFNTAKSYYKEQLIGAIQQQQMRTQAAQDERRAIYQSIVDFTQQKQAEEPHFADINQLMDSYYQTMPYKDAAVIGDAIKALQDGNINPTQCKVLEGYYDKCRTAYYAKANDLTKQPKKVPVPKVEQPGTGAKAPAKPINFTQMRNMTVRERRAFIAGLSGR
jgi:hypothetical protein